MRVMTPLILIIIVTSLTNCGKFKAKGIIDPEFRPYVELFAETYGVYINVDMYFDELEGTIIGRCWKKGEARDIEIDVSWWSNNTDPYDRELLVFHELGHCVLDQGHRDFFLEDGCGGSIMVTIHIGGVCYERHYDYYIEELR